MCWIKFFIRNDPANSISVSFIYILYDFVDTEQPFDIITDNTFETKKQIPFRIITDESNPLLLITI